jgi:hypothetical protein
LSDLLDGGFGSQHRTATKMNSVFHMTSFFSQRGT